MENQTVTTTTSKQFSWNWRDILKGFLMAAIGAIISPIMDSLNAGEFTFNWKHTLAIAIGSGLSYLAKNFFTPSQTIIKVTPPVEETKKD